MTAFAHESRHLAEIYDRVSDFQFDGGKRLVERLGLEEEARVLDVGCGTGRLARWIAERLGPRGSVVGIDPLEHRISVARSHAGVVRFEVGQAEDLGAFADSSFDAVCLSSVLHWVADKSRALAEIRRVLRPGGRVAVTTLPQELSRAGTVALVLQSLLQRPPYADHVDRSVGMRGCTSTELVSLVLESRLELVELHVTQTVSGHESGEAFVEFAEASSFGSFLAMVPEDLRASLRAEVLDELGDAIESVLTRATTKHGSINALFLARVTCDSRRELVYRVPDPEVANGALAKAVTEQQGREWSYNLFRDDSWGAAAVFQDLFESAFD